MAILLSSKAGGLIRLAPNLGWPSQLDAGQYYENDAFDPSGTLTTVLNLTEGHVIHFLSLSGMPTAELCTVNCVIDGETIWDDVDFTPANASIFLWGSNASATRYGTGFTFNDTLVLKVKTATDTVVNRLWAGHPIK